MKKIDLEPKCFTDKWHLATTNRGELIPCCYIDTEMGLQDPVIQNLIAVSKLEDANSISEILDKKEWLEFKEILSNEGPYPKVCVHNCQKRTDGDCLRIENYISGDSSKDQVQRKF